MTEPLDAKDVGILRALKMDPRKSMGLIGDELGVSKATVSRRVARMEEEGHISGYSVDVDPNRLGLIRSLVSIQVIGSPVSVIIEQLRTYPEVSFIYKSFGDHNLVCEVFTKNIDGLHDMVQNRLLRIPNVRNVDVDILVERVAVNVDADLDTYMDRIPEQGEK